MTMDPVWLTHFWAGVIALAILAYVVLDGYDLGVRILFGTTASESRWVTMMNAIAPFWDGNKTWLVLSLSKVSAIWKGSPNGFFQFYLIYTSRGHVCGFFKQLEFWI